MQHSIADCTVAEKVLLGAYQLEEQGESPFSAEALVVASWQKFPRTFGLKGYSDQYPDSNKVLTSIMGEKGLTKRGWLAKMGQKLYTVTKEGRALAKRLLQAGEPDTPIIKAKLNRDQEKFLLHLLSSTALEKYQQGLKQELTFADACRFWDISESHHGEVVNARLDHCRATLAEVERLLQEAPDVTLSNGRSISARETALVGKVDQYLEDRFGRHLSLLRSRASRN
ncbi:MAG: hypothetical protein ACK4RK_18780 [Gemmataceae bacterium]